ncbi:hypothetical protein [Streptomyces sp. NPDC058861]|uniref:hypothetical protein n=1 Tax=Streptomyces sp. NPDC058861 TaxID=3346653 RepID=UPI003681E490
MPDTRTHGGYRTGGLWAGVGISLGAVVIGSGLALFAMLEYDERCAHGMVQGPGRLLRTRNQAFPPATVCEFERGEVSSLGGSWLPETLLWAALAVLVVCLFAALVADWFEPRPGGPLVEPRSRAEQVSRTGAAFLATGSLFLLLYALAGWELLAGPSSACSAGGGWGSLPPRTLEYSFFPPQATCQYRSGGTALLTPDWLSSLTALAALPALVAGTGFVLAWRRRREERRGAGGRGRGVRDTAGGNTAREHAGPGRTDTGEPAGSG